MHNSEIPATIWSSRSHTSIFAFPARRQHLSQEWPKGHGPLHRHPGRWHQGEYESRSSPSPANDPPWIPRSSIRRATATSHSSSPSARARSSVAGMRELPSWASASAPSWFARRTMPTVAVATPASFRPTPPSPSTSSCSRSNRRTGCPMCIPQTKSQGVADRRTGDEPKNIIIGTRTIQQHLPTQNNNDNFIHSSKLELI